MKCVEDEMVLVERLFLVELYIKRNCGKNIIVNV